MTQKILRLGCVIMGVLLFAACSSDDTPSDTPPEAQQLGLLEWNQDSNYVVLRVDQQYLAGSPAQQANEIPSCTVWGDGHVVWLNYITPENSATQVQLLEAYLNEEQMRALIETVIFSGFYDWESNFIIPNSNNQFIQSLSLNLFSEERTVSRYSDWPVNGHERIRETCTQASDSPAIFLPDGLWLSAYEVPYDDGVGHWRWYSDAAGFGLDEVSGGNSPRWLSGDLAKDVFNTTILSNTSVHALDGDLSYELVVQVPQVTRDAPPAPDTTP